MICTWKNCNEKAEHEQLDRDGNTWANLCEGHHNELDAMLDLFVANGNPKGMVRCWILANGGAKKMSQRMVGRANDSLE